MSNKSKWRIFSESVPNSGANVVQDLEISEVASSRQIGDKTCIKVNGETADGKERKGILIPVDAELEYNPDTFTLSGGKMSGTGHSYTQPGYKWDIPEPDDTMVAVKDVADLVTA